MADEPVNQNEDQEESAGTLGNEPDTTAEADGTADHENADQDTTDSRDDAVAEGHETARENADREREEQPEPEA